MSKTVKKTVSEKPLTGEALVIENTQAEIEALDHAVKTDPAQNLKTIDQSTVEAEVSMDTASSFQSPPSEKNSPSGKKHILHKMIPSKRVVFGLTTFVILFTAIGSAGFFYFKYLETEGKLNNSVLGVNFQDQIKALVSRVSEVAELPTGETPQVATVSNIQELSGQPFFKNAKNGDKLLIYNTAGKAYLYRPDTHKIIEIGPVVKQSAESTPASQSATLGASTSATPTPEKQVKVTLLNGTTKIGLTRTAESALKELNMPLQVVDRDNAKNATHEKTVVVNVTGSNQAASEVASALQAEIGDLPEGEDTPAGIDILVILGSDFLN